MKEEEEIEELKNRLKLIEEYYEENNYIKRIKFYWRYIKEKKRNADNRNSTKNDTTRNNTIYNNSNGDTWDNEISKIFNDKKVEMERLQQENERLKDKINKLEILVENLKLGVTLNTEQEDLLDKVLFGGDSK